MTKQTAPQTKPSLVKRVAKFMLQTMATAVMLLVLIITAVVVQSELHEHRNPRFPGAVTEETPAQTIERMTALAEFICIVGPFAPHGDRDDHGPDVAKDTTVQACAFAKAHATRTGDIARTPPQLDQPLTREAFP